MITHEFLIARLNTEYSGIRGVDVLRQMDEVSICEPARLSKEGSIINCQDRKSSSAYLSADNAAR
jgi:hypothetical protein